jgi:hypothetical protein
VIGPAGMNAFAFAAHATAAWMKLVLALSDRAANVVPMRAS